MMRLRFPIGGTPRAFCSCAISAVVLLACCTLLISSAFADNTPDQSVITGSLVLSDAVQEPMQFFAIGKTAQELVQLEDGDRVAAYPLSAQTPVALVAWDANDDGFAEPVVVTEQTLEFPLNLDGSSFSPSPSIHTIGSSIEIVTSAAVVDSHSTGSTQLLLGGTYAESHILSLLVAFPNALVEFSGITAPHAIDFLVSDPHTPGRAFAVSRSGSVSVVVFDEDHFISLGTVIELGAEISAVAVGRIFGSEEVGIVAAGADTLFTVSGLDILDPAVTTQQFEWMAAPSNLVVLESANGEIVDLAVTSGSVPGLASLQIFRRAAGGFELSQTFTPGGIPSGAAAVDFDYDGDKDIVFSDSINNYLYTLERTASDSPDQAYRYRGDLSGAVSQDTVLPLGVRPGAVVGSRVSLDDQSFAFSAVDGSYRLLVPYGHTNISAQRDDFSFLRQNYMSLLSARYRINFLAAVGDVPPIPPEQDTDDNQDSSTPDGGFEVPDFVEPDLPDAPDPDDQWEADTDGDGKSDLQEMLDGSNPFDSGSYKPSTDGTRYAFWNTFLGQHNILEAANPNDFEIQYSARLLNAFGAVVGSTSFAAFSAKTQQDIIADDGSESDKPSYGLVRESASAASSGRLVRYRFDDSGRVESAAVSSLRSALRGSSVVPFNTFHPDSSASGSDSPVENWLSLANLSDSPHQFEIRFYSSAGFLLDTSIVTVAPRARVDTDGGHRFGYGVIGLIEIAPTDPQALYAAELSRYSTASGSTSFSTTIPANPGNGQTQYLSIDSLDGAAAWLETANAADVPVSTVINFFDAAGAVVDSIEFELPAKGQKHINLNAAASGSAVLIQVVPGAATSISAHCIKYHKNSNSETWGASSVPAREAFDSILSASYNLFLEASNTLIISNASNISINAVVTSNRSSIEVELPPFSSSSIDLNGELFGLQPDSYGLVTVQSSVPGTIISSVIRSRRDRFAIHTPLQ